VVFGKFLMASTAFVVLDDIANYLLPSPLIAFQPTTGAPSSPTSIATDHSLLELDNELDALLDQIQDEIEEQGEAGAEGMKRFQRLIELAAC
jgi:hypothetical protein